MNKRLFVMPSLTTAEDSAKLREKFVAGQPSNHPTQPISVTSEAAQTATLGSNHYEIGQIALIPVDTIRDNPFNARVNYSDADIDELGRLMEAHGQTTPAQGYVENGHVYLIDGQRRWKAARAFGIQTLRTEIVNKPAPRDIYLRSRSMNVDRRTQTVIDDALRFSEMIDKGIFSDQKDLGLAVGLDQSQISRYLGVNKIPENVRRTLLSNERTTGTSIVVAIARLFQDDAVLGGGDPAHADEKADVVAISLINTIVAEELSSKAVEGRVGALLSVRKRKPRAASYTVPYAGRNVTVKQNPSKGQLTVSVLGLSPEKLEELVKKIDDVLKQTPTT